MRIDFFPSLSQGFALTFRYCEKEETTQKIIIIAVTCALAVGIFYIISRLKNNISDDSDMVRTSFSVAENVSAEDFKEFYYTYATTNSPKFQKYRFNDAEARFSFEDF